MSDEMVELLRAIRDEAKKTNERLEMMDGRLETVETEVSLLRREVKERDAWLQVGQKDILTELRGLRGEAYSDVHAIQEDVHALKDGVVKALDYGPRIAKLEAAVFKPSRPPRARAARR